MSRYEISMDKGQTWKDITKRDARRKLSRIAHDDDLAFSQIDKGRWYNMLTRGWLRRKKGRWNSKQTMTHKQLQLLARHLVTLVQCDRDKSINNYVPLAMNAKDRYILKVEMNKLMDKETAKLAETKGFQDVC